jgi:hypothetical protein
VFQWHVDVLDLAEGEESGVHHRVGHGLVEATWWRGGGTTF